MSFLCRSVVSLLRVVWIDPDTLGSLDGRRLRSPKGPRSALSMTIDEVGLPDAIRDPGDDRSRSQVAIRIRRIVPRCPICPI